MRFQLDNRPSGDKEAGNVYASLFGVQVQTFGDQKQWWFFSLKTYWFEAQSRAHQLTEEKTKW